jgi:hypothetical protein
MLLVPLCKQFFNALNTQKPVCLFPLVILHVFKADRQDFIFNAFELFGL